RKKPCIQLLFPSRPPLSAFRALRPMPQRVAEVTGAAAATSAAIEFLALPPETFRGLQALPEAGVAECHTMHPPPAIVHLGTIPIHPAKKCPPVERPRGRDTGVAPYFSPPKRCANQPPFR